MMDDAEKDGDAWAVCDGCVDDNSAKFLRSWSLLVLVATAGPNSSEPGEA